MLLLIVVFSNVFKIYTNLCLLLNMLWILFPLFLINAVFLQCFKCSIGFIDLLIQENAELPGIPAKSAHDQTAQHPGDTHIIVEWCQQSLMVSSLIFRISASGKFSSFFGLQLHPIELQHHHVRFYISLRYLFIVPKLLGFLLSEGHGESVESGLEWIRKQPLYEPVMCFQ